METPIEHNILRTLAYFDLFDYPLSGAEIWRFLGFKTGMAQITRTLKKLVYAGVIFRKEEWYSLKNESSLTERRKELNRTASAMLPRAGRIARLLYGFPFVRAVCISGSLSKHCADRNADIDFFLITKRNRLWLARTFLHILKKLAFLTGHEHCLCMNYFVDEEGLSIIEKNIFTATEIITLLPLHPDETMQAFLDANAWVHEYFPNLEESRSAIQLGNRWLLPKKVFEILFDNRLGSWLDDYLMRLTTRRWKQKEEAQRLNIKGKRMGIRTDKHFCKPNPVYFQENLLNKYRQRITELETSHQFHISA